MSKLAPHSRYMDLVARAGCVICTRFENTSTAPELHHVAEGSGVRSDYMVVGLCPEHHRGPTGLHGMGPKAFLRFYRPPGESEYGLLGWVAEDITKKGLI